MLTEHEVKRLEEIRDKAEKELDENEPVKEELEDKDVLPKGYIVRNKWGERYFV